VIDPYLASLEEEIPLRDGRRVSVRPIRADDAPLLQRLFAGLSERSRYQRFMQYVSELSPAMLVRFTRIDYHRELALLALHGDELIAVGRYAPDEDGRNAEFALVVADAWQGRGLGRQLLERLVKQARKAEYQALYGHILDANRDMLELARKLGFAAVGRSGDAIIVKRSLLT
jgi:acetyltransferase